MFKPFTIVLEHRFVEKSVQGNLPSLNTSCEYHTKNLSSNRTYAKLTCQVTTEDESNMHYSNPG